LKLKVITNRNIPIISTIDWGSETVQGKIFLPHLEQDSLPDILEELKPQGIIALRKLYNDPRKAHSPIYVITCIGNECPEYIKIAYLKCKIKKYYPSPLRCGNCFRWGHTTASCTSAMVCSHCSQKGHKKENCETEEAKCINCQEAHDSKSKDCRKYQKELQICKIKVDQNISFREARKIVESNSNGEQRRTVSENQQHQEDNQFLQASAFPPLATKNQNGKKKLQSESETIKQTKRNFWLERQQAEETNTLSGNQPEQSDISQIITPGQRTPRVHQHEEHSEWNLLDSQRNDPFSTQQEYLPSELPTINYENYAGATEIDKEMELNRKYQHRKELSMHEIIQSSLTNIIIKLIPSLLKLYLSSNTKNIIECFIEIGKTLNIESLINPIVRDIERNLESNSQ